VRRALLPRLALFVVAVGCLVTATSAATSETATSCPSAAAVAHLRAAHTIRADLGGNGRVEGARVVRSQGAPPQCRWFVDVTAGTRTASIVVPRILLALGRPELFGVVRLGTDARREIVVRFNLGADTNAFALYTFERGAIKRVHVAVRGSHDLLYAGSGGSLIAVACLDRGSRHVVASEAVSDGSRIHVDRHMFRLAGDSLVQTSAQKLVNANPEQLPEFQPAEKYGLRGLTFWGCNLRVPGK
jgi:hypothetical protein